MCSRVSKKAGIKCIFCFVVFCFQILNILSQTSKRWCIVQLLLSWLQKFLNLFFSFAVSIFYPLFKQSFLFILKQFVAYLLKCRKKEEKRRNIPFSSGYHMLKWLQQQQTAKRSQMMDGWAKKREWDWVSEK